MSVDLKPCNVPGNHHTGDVFDVIMQRTWDMLIAFPPCTYLCKAQLWRCNRSGGRKAKQVEAIDFVHQLMSLDIPQIAIENPIGVLSSAIRPPDQIVHPWWFGDPYRKDVCLWLKDIPPLIATCYSQGRKPVTNHVNGRMSQALKSEIKSSWLHFPRMCEAIVNQWM